MHKGHDESDRLELKHTAEPASTDEDSSRKTTERKQVKTALQESNRMLKALSFVQSYYISGLSMPALFRIILNNFVALSDSKIGFIGETLYTPAGNRYIKTVALTDIDMPDTGNSIYEEAVASGIEFHKHQTLFGAVLTTEQAVIANDPATDPRRGGTPEGHPPLDAFLGLPIHHGDKLLGVVGLANRPGGYNKKLVTYLEPFLITCGNIIEANRTRQRQEAVEDLLRQSEERYRRITDGLTDYIYTVSVEEGKAVKTKHGPACWAVTGYTPQDYEDEPSLWSRMIVAEDREQVAVCIEKILRGERVPLFEHRIIHKDGKIRWISNTFIPQFDSSGTLVAYDGVIKDITEYKQAAELVYKSEITFRMAIDGIPDPLFMLDPKLRIIKLNRAARDYYGLSRYSNAIGKLCFEAFAGRSSPCEGCESPFSDIQGYSGSFERKSPHPDRIEEVVVDIVSGLSGVPEAYIVRIFDITQARMLDRQMIQSEKLAAMGLLVAGVAHEINNPNNFIHFNIPILRSYLQFLLPIADEYASAHPQLHAFGRSYSGFREDCLKLLDNIEHGSNRINRIVGNLREFAHDRGKCERCWVDLKHVVEKSLSICQGRIKKLVKTIDVNIPERVSPLIIFTDPLAIEQIVVNILINAAQAADKPDSLIRVTISEYSVSEGEAVIEVSDNGCGMDSETREKIFNPFFTSKAPGIGTGLGLSISYRLITELKGRIEIESKEGKGSTFRIILPVKQS